MRPVLLTVDDDAQVVRAIERDLRQHYGKRFRVLKAGSGQKALQLVKQLKLRNEALALLLVDQRMPHLSGVDFLEQAMNIFPETAAGASVVVRVLDPSSALKLLSCVDIKREP
jgi:thioredoxin reductase (NADPH)